MHNVPFLQVMLVMTKCPFVAVRTTAPTCHSMYQLCGCWYYWGTASGTSSDSTSSTSADRNTSNENEGSLRTVLTEINAPPMTKRRGRPKGHHLTTIGLLVKKKAKKECAKRPTSFRKLRTSKKEEGTYMHEKSKAVCTFWLMHSLLAQFCKLANVDNVTHTKCNVQHHPPHTQAFSSNHTSTRLHLRMILARAC